MNRSKVHDKFFEEPPEPSMDNPTVKELESEKKRFFSISYQLKSLAFGLVCGGLSLLLLVFTAFNEIIIAPFIRPSQSANTVIVDPAATTSAPVDTSPKVIIPKISVDIPVVYGASADTKQFEQALDQGVVHYPTTVLPGQTGNAAYFGHSSNNIFNPGKYKFAFVLLREMAPGDTFYLLRDGTRYTYEVISKRVVKPTEIGVLGPVDGEMATATLITCDPPGTSTNRLVVVGRQTDPNPTDATAAPVPDPVVPGSPEAKQDLPGNGPMLLNRLWRSITGN